VVSTHPKNSSQHGNLPQIGVKYLKKCLKPPPRKEFTQKPGNSDLSKKKHHLPRRPPSRDHPTEKSAPPDLHGRNVFDLLQHPNLTTSMVISCGMDGCHETNKRTRKFHPDGLANGKMWVSDICRN